MKSRPSFRAMYATFWDDPDVLDLSHVAYRVLTTLKGTLPAAGIAQVLDDVLARRCRITVEELLAAYQELEQPKGRADAGWIMRDRGVVWLINGLRYESQIKPTDVKHLKFIADALSPLGGVDSPLPIVRAFKEAYPAWFPVQPATAEPSGDKVHGKGPYPRALGEGLGAAQNQNQNLVVVGSEEKISEANTSSKTTTTTEPLPKGLGEGPSTPLHGVARAGVPATAIDIAIWANTAAAERWKFTLEPFTAGGAAQLAADLAALGVDGVMVHGSIYRQCRASRDTKPPNSPNWFRPGIEKAFDHAGTKQATRESASASTPPPRPDDAPSRRSQSSKVPLLYGDLLSRK